MSCGGVDSFCQRTSGKRLSTYGNCQPAAVDGQRNTTTEGVGKLRRSEMAPHVPLLRSLVVFGRWLL